MGSHTVLPATRHKWTRPSLTPASKLVLDLLAQRDRRLSWPRLYPAMHWPGVELAISRSLVRRPNRYTTELWKKCRPKCLNKYVISWQSGTFSKCWHSYHERASVMECHSFFSFSSLLLIFIAWRNAQRGISTARRLFVRLSVRL